MHYLVLAQADKLGEKALDTVVQAIQAGMVGVAIILGAAIIVQAIANILSNRSSSRTTDELLKYNGRLATAIEKMDGTLDKMTDQQEEMSTLFAELTATLREIPQMFASVRTEIGLMRKDFSEYAKLTDGTVGSIQNEMKDLIVVMDRRLGEINTKLQKMMPDTQPLPAISDSSPSTLPEQKKPDLLEDKKGTGDTS